MQFSIFFFSHSANKTKQQDNKRWVWMSDLYEGMVVPVTKHDSVVKHCEKGEVRQRKKKVHVSKFMSSLLNIY